MANWLSGYTTRKKITIDKSKIDADLTDFPVLVKLTSSNFDFSKANSDGFDLRFTSSDGTTLLKYERERHDATNKLAEYWVKIPSISSTANTIFYLYYRVEDTDDGADPTNVWDSNFKGVWHMKDLTTSTIEDSTSNNNDGTKKAANEPIQADGQIAKAQSFDGTDDYINLGRPASLNLTSAWTLEAWVKPTSSPNGSGIITEAFSGDNIVQYELGFGMPAARPRRLMTGFFHSGAWSLAEDSVDISTNQWIHIIGTWDGTTLRVYKNGASVGSNVPGRSSQAGSESFWIGRRHDTYTSASFFPGLIDEVRISNTCRSAAWIKASYNSENNSLVSYGAEEGIDNAIFFGINL